VSRPKPVVVVGSINTDLVSFTERIPRVGETVLGKNFQILAGGKGANQAVTVARLGYPVRIIGRVGTDSFGADALRHLANAGVDTACVKTSEGPSGVAAISVSEAGENSIVVTPGANWMISPQDIDENLAVIRESCIVLAQLEIPIETVEYLSDICAREDVPLMLDPAPARDLPSGMFKNIAWFTPNQTEAAFFAENHGHHADAGPRALADQLLARGIRRVVLKLGSDGALICCNGSTARINSFAVNAVDTTAAGDAFNGGFAVGLMRGMTSEESGRFAAAVSAISVTRRGARDSMPSLDEVESFLAEHKSRGENAQIH
jgi:ribokinase